jgi:hypothetical protein
MTRPGDPPDDADGDSVGYRQPLKKPRFAKGQSGNPAGRPRGRHREAPYQAILGRMVTIRESGATRRVTAAEAFLLQIAKRGVEGDSAAARASLAVIEEARNRLQGIVGPLHIIWKGMAPGSVTPSGVAGSPFVGTSLPSAFLPTVRVSPTANIRPSNVMEHPTRAN